MSDDRIAATRNNLLRARSQLDRVRKGASVVHRKRQALVSHLFRIARPAVDARTEIAQRSTDATGMLVDAFADVGSDALRTLAVPAAPIEVEIQPAQVWGVAVADVAAVSPVRRTLDARGTPPGSTSPAVVAATNAYEHLTELLLTSAANEIRVTRLAEAVAAASRQLQVLQHRIEPRLVAQIGQMRRTLEEREREEHLRLKHLREVRSRRN